MDIHILEIYTIRTLEKAYENVGFTIVRVANDRAYDTRQHFTMLALLRTATYYSRFRVTVCDAYLQQLPNLMFALHTKRSRIFITDSRALFKGARIRESRSNKMYLALYYPSNILDLSTEQLQYIAKVILLRVYGPYRPCVGQAFRTREGGFEGSNLRRCDEHYNQLWQ